MANSSLMDMGSTSDKNYYTVGTGITSNLTLVLPLEWAGRTLESFLRQQLHLSRNRIIALKHSRGIAIGGRTVHAGYRIGGGELLRLQFPGVEQSIPPEPVPLEICYEDRDLVIVNKPAGLVVHPVHQYPNGTLANGLVFHWRQLQEPASFHPLHRLDRLTSGLVLVAKNPWVHQQLARQLGNTFHRFYLAVCLGVPDPASGRINQALGRTGTGVKRAVSVSGKPALTRYRVIRRTQAASLVAIRLLTGRTHQIRAHMSYLGFPLWGDSLYGVADEHLARPALHAARLEFIHPRTQKRVRLNAPLPCDLTALLGKLGMEPPKSLIACPYG